MANEISFFCSDFAKLAVITDNQTCQNKNWYTFGMQRR